MANSTVGLSHIPVFFLNHLCDGEHNVLFGLWAFGFLNHLCDGELFAVKFLPLRKFLNHLCDGEHRMGLSLVQYGFLNHLCDGEQAA